MLKFLYTGCAVQHASADYISSDSFTRLWGCYDSDPVIEAGPGCRVIDMTSHGATDLKHSAGVSFTRDTGSTTGTERVENSMYQSEIHVAKNRERGRWKITDFNLIGIKTADTYKPIGIKIYKKLIC